ncbi:MAG: uroporphyrinogen decarboxylase family protein [Thermoplasmata archaeon]
MHIDQDKQDKIVLKIASGNEKGNAVWFMRQAGRYLPEYSRIRGDRKFLDMMKDYRTIVEVTKLPLNYFDTDALVIFSDILIPATRIGYSLSYEGGIVVNKKDDYFDYYDPLTKAIKEIALLYSKKTIIGITPGPFTFLSYLYDNGEKGYPSTKKAIVEKKQNIDDVIEELVNFSKVQAQSGVDLIQIFESWIGNVSNNFYEKYLKEIEFEYMMRLKELKKPLIFFSEGSSHLFKEICSLEADVYSIDWRTDFYYLREFCDECIVQGNLDPNLLSLDEKYIGAEINRIMMDGSKMKGHIFNLGHGVPVWAKPEKLDFIVKKVKEFE